MIELAILIALVILLMGVWLGWTARGGGER